MALALGVAGCGSSDSASASRPSGSGARRLSPDALAVRAARRFLDTYLTSGGRIQRTDQGGDTVSEGQAYGMLVAAAIGDRSRFERIWSWTRRHLEQSSGLFAFHWQGGRVLDPHPSADADLDTARALLVGACRFGQRSLRTQALRIGEAVLAHESAKVGGIEVLLPGPWAARESSLSFNPSYVDPATLRALAAASGNARFSALATGGVQLVAQLTRPLPPDWATVNRQTGQARPVSGAGATGGAGMFTYDAPRTLVRLAEAPSSPARAALARAWSVFAQTRPQDIVTEHQLSGAPAGSSHNPVTLVAVAGAARAAGHSGDVLPLLAEAERRNEQQPTYYGAAWLALGRLLLTTNRLAVCRS